MSKRKPARLPLKRTKRHQQTLKSVMVTTQHGDAFNLNMFPNAAAGIMTMIITGIKSLAPTPLELNFLGGAIVEAIKPVIETSHDHNDSRLTPGLTNALAVRTGVVIPKDAKYVKGVANFRYAIRYVTLSTDPEGRRRSYFETSQYTAEWNASNDELGRQLIERIRTGEGRYWFSSYMTRIGDIRGVGVDSVDGELVFDDGTPVTLPHPEFGHDLLSIVLQKYQAKYATEEPMPYHAWDEKLTIAHLQVTSEQGETFTLDLVPRNCRFYIMLISAIVRSITRSRADYNHVGFTLGKAIYQLNKDAGITTPYDITKVDPTLYYACTIPPGGDIEAIVANPPPVDATAKLRNGCYSLDTYHTAMRTGKVPTDITIQHTAELFAILKALIDGEVDSVCITRDTHFIGDPRHIGIRLHDDRFWFRDGERLELPHPDYQDDILAIVYDKYMRTYS